MTIYTKQRILTGGTKSKPNQNVGVSV